jgi:phosphoribosylamine--glycine ligase
MIWKRLASRRSGRRRLPRAWKARSVHQRPAPTEIPTGAYQHFTQPEPAKAYVREQPLPIVIKADGLAAGKGVIIAATLAEAEAAIDTCFGGAFGAAGSEIIVEEFLDGEEASFFALIDGTAVVPLGTAQDHKRAFDGDQGPNTGGMGAYSPAAVMTPELTRRAMDEIVLPTAAAMVEAGTPFRGVLFVGLMLTVSGPQLVEFNVRLGDPECQALMVRLKSDLLTALPTRRAARYRPGVSDDIHHVVWRRAAIRAIMNPARKSRGWRRPPPCPVCGFSTRAPHWRTASSWPRAGAS